MLPPWEGRQKVVVRRVFLFRQGLINGHCNASAQGVEEQQVVFAESIGLTDGIHVNSPVHFRIADERDTENGAYLKGFVVVFCLFDAFKGRIGYSSAHECYRRL